MVDYASHRRCFYHRLTAAVLKTLCYASKLTFLDKENLIDKSFSWLAEQVNYRKGTILELDWRVSQDSLEYKVMLSAEVLITLLECKGFVFEKHFFLMAYLVTYLEEHLHKIQQPVVLAKSVYALDLSDEKDKDEVRSKALKRLLLMKRTNKLGQYFWAEKDDDDSGSVPFWYQLGAKASSIEATSYALLVFLQRRGQMEHIDSIADWLVGQRNENGAFVGAMDSMAAIQALSRYSLAKRQGDLLETDLSCNVISEIFTGRQTHSFKFTQQDATSPKSVDNVPVGHKLKVSTKGKGLGQMQVNVEYNVPVDRNANCHFNLTVMVKRTEIRWTGDMLSNPICNTCGIGCHEKSPDKREETKMEVRPSPGRRRTNKRRVPQSSKYRPRTPTSANSHWNLVHSAPPVPNIRRISPPSRKLPSSTTSYRSIIDSTQAGQNQRHRSRRSYTTASKFSICIHVCLRHMQEGSSGYTFIEVEMLTGYLPVISDLDRIEKNSNIRKAQFLHDRDIVVVQFDRVPSDEQTCFTFRAVEEHEVEKRTPASVVLRQAGLSQPSCALEYNPVRRVEYPLQGYCTNTYNEQGECPCFSGRCSSCLPTPGHRAKMNLDTLMNLACEADVGYELKVTNVTNKNQWVEIDATVIQRNKTGSHAVQPNETITLMTPSVCNCPHFYFPPGGETEDMMYLLSTDAEIFLDRRGQRVYRYLLDERSKILRVSHSAKKTLQSSSPAASHYDLETAFLQLWKCE
ncbi:hypothetical protein RRG08_047524 [Elysia crispata]|uniref:Alpha-macroglobulin receptor-binding domain-containing protein n=1 Tax=Elysia crispata TaxID=231223 RepID=A0AAE0ZQH0_9GAST|nr:hypothetical protein RRG08_047524 [Elysia crispata]